MNEADETSRISGKDITNSEKRHPKGLKETMGYLRGIRTEDQEHRLRAAREALEELQEAERLNEAYKVWSPEGPPVSYSQIERLREEAEHLQRQTTWKGRMRSAIEYATRQIIYNTDMLMVSMCNIGNVRPMLNDEGKPIWVIMPNARIDFDPRQSESQIHNGKDNVYYKEFMGLKAQGVKAITAEHMNGNPPWVRVKGIGRLQFLDHNRILGAQEAKIPIEAVFTRGIDTFD